MHHLLRRPGFVVLINLSFAQSATASSPCSRGPGEALWNQLDRAERVVVAEVEEKSLSRVAELYYGRTLLRVLDRVDRWIYRFDSGLSLLIDESLPAFELHAPDLVPIQVQIRILDNMKGSGARPSTILASPCAPLIPGQKTVLFLERGLLGWQLTGTWRPVFLLQHSEEIAELSDWITSGLGLRLAEDERARIEWMTRGFALPSVCLVNSDELRKIPTGAHLEGLEHQLATAPPIDRCLPVALHLVRDRADPAIDLSIATMIEGGLALDAPPSWLFEAMTALFDRLGLARRSEIDPFAFEQQPEQTRQIWHESIAGMTLEAKEVERYRRQIEARDTWLRQVVIDGMTRSTPRDQW